MKISYSTSKIPDVATMPTKFEETNESPTIAYILKKKPSLAESRTTDHTVQKLRRYRWATWEGMKHEKKRKRAEMLK